MTTPDPAAGQEQPYDWTQDTELSEYAKEQFLPTLPEDQRNLVAPHVKSWDSGYQKQVNRIKEQYQQELGKYSQLGSPDSLSQHVQVSSAFQSDPYGTIKRLVEANYLDRAQLQELVGMAEQMGGGQQTPPPQPDPSQFDFSKHPEWQKTQQAIQGMANWVMTQEQQRAQQQQDQALNQTLEQIKAKAPGIDDTYALSIAYAMMRDNKPVDVDAIANQWNTMRQGILSQGRAPAPARTMPGAGAPNTRPADPSKMNSDDRIKFLTQALLNNPS